MEISRWQKFKKREQLLMIGSEFLRAKTWQKKDNEKFISALWRALDLIDLTLSDSKWKNDSRILLGLRQEVARFYSADRVDDVSLLYNAL